jgi:hypothetical protein
MSSCRLRSPHPPYAGRLTLASSWMRACHPPSHTCLLRTTSERLEAASTHARSRRDASASRRSSTRLRAGSAIGWTGAGLGERLHGGAFLGPAATRRGGVEREPAVAALTVGDAADQSGLDRAATAGEPLCGAVAAAKFCCGMVILRFSGPARRCGGPLLTWIGRVAAPACLEPRAARTTGVV